MINKIKGTQDILDLTIYNFFLDAAKKHLAIYNFNEISTPILEPTDLFKRAIGEDTDVVSKEMYTVNTGHESEESICLRPEATASIVRAFVNNSIQQIPWKVYEHGAMFRHERPQKGRFREFHQLTMEIIGSKAIEQDVQFIKMLDRFFCEVLTLDSFALVINFLGCSDDRVKFKEVLNKYLEKINELCATCSIRKEKNILRIFDCKNPKCQEYYAASPKITDNLCEICTKEWESLKNNLEHLSVSYSHNPSLVRGLDYYEKTVFEFVSISTLGAQNTFCGGGRYHKLAQIIGSREDQPSVGAAIGIERIVLMLEEIKDRLLLPMAKKLYVIIPMGHEHHSLALLVADELHASKLSTEVLLEGDSVKSMMRQANKLGAGFALLIGTEEQANKVITVKNMITGNEEKVPQSKLLEYLNH